MDSTNPLDGSSIRKNVFMFICGASVHCRPLMDFATAAIDATTDALESVMPTNHLRVTRRFWEPLRIALTMIFEQGARPCTVAMRLALAQLVDVALPWLMQNQNFQRELCSSWTLYVFPNCVYDNVYFREKGWLQLMADQETTFQEMVEKVAAFGSPVGEPNDSLNSADADEPSCGGEHDNPLSIDA